MLNKFTTFLTTYGNKYLKNYFYIMIKINKSEESLRKKTIYRETIQLYNATKRIGQYLFKKKLSIFA